MYKIAARVARLANCILLLAPSQGRTQKYIKNLLDRPQLKIYWINKTQDGGHDDDSM